MYMCTYIIRDGSSLYLLVLVVTFKSMYIEIHVHACARSMNKERRETTLKQDAYDMYIPDTCTYNSIEDQGTHIHTCMYM